MAAVYKSLSKSNGHKEEGSSAGIKKNKQKVLILSSRGVTYRYGAFTLGTIHHNSEDTDLE
jgi:ribosome biogenesis protein BRX1